MCWACQVPKRVAGVSLLRVPCWEQVPPLIFRLTTRGRRVRSAALLSEGRAGLATKVKSSLINASMRRHNLPCTAEGSSKPKPRWDVHLTEAGNRAGRLYGMPRLLIAGLSGTAVSPRLCGWPVRQGICRPSPAPPPCFPSTDCRWPPLSSSPRWPHPR